MNTLSSNSFRAGGPLGAEDEAVYVPRPADQELRRALLEMKYIMVIEPRQQGKTSLAMHAMRDLQHTDLIFVYVDTSTLENETQAVWYTDLCARISPQLENKIVPSSLSLPQNSYQWRAYLENLARSAVQAGVRIAIILDEIGSIHFPGSDLFFSVLREIFNLRHVQSHFKAITFMLVGVFDPGELIKDSRISPFNVALRIQLQDFALDQVRHLISAVWSDERADGLARRIYHWTEGQPYLTQALCSSLRVDAKPEDVDVCVQKLCSEDASHLPGIINRLTKNARLLKYLKETINKQVKFNEMDPRHRELRLLGLVKGDEHENFRIRNQIYAYILKELQSDALGDGTDLRQRAENERSSAIYIQGDYIAGGKTMADKHISINGSTVHGSVVAAENIQDSFNLIEKSSAKEELKGCLTQLTLAVETMLKELPQALGEETADYMKRLSEEATKTKPNPKWYNVSIDGLIAAAQNLGKVGDNVIELAGKVRKILMGGLF